MCEEQKECYRFCCHQLALHTNSNSLKLESLRSQGGSQSVMPRTNECNFTKTLPLLLRSGGFCELWKDRLMTDASHSHELIE